MFIVIFGSGLLALAFALHLLFWRIYLPKRQIRMLLIIFAITLLVGLTAGNLLFPNEFSPWIFWNNFHIILFYVSTSLAYTALYSAIEEDSPSLSITKFVHAAGKEGRSREEIAGLITDDILVESRVGALLRDGLVREAGDHLELSRRGLVIARSFRAVATVLNLRKGG